MFIKWIKILLNIVYSNYQNMYNKLLLLLHNLKKWKLNNPPNNKHLKYNKKKTSFHQYQKQLKLLNPKLKKKLLINFNNFNKKDNMKVLFQWPINNKVKIVLIHVYFNKWIIVVQIFKYPTQTKQIMNYQKKNRHKWTQKKKK